MDQEQDDFADFRKSLAGLGGAERKAQLKAMEDAILENWRTQVVPDLYVDEVEQQPAPAPKQPTPDYNSPDYKRFSDQRAAEIKGQGLSPQEERAAMDEIYMDYKPGGGAPPKPAAPQPFRSVIDEDSDPADPDDLIGGPDMRGAYERGAETQDSRLADAENHMKEFYGDYQVGQVGEEEPQQSENYSINPQWIEWKFSRASPQEVDAQLARAQEDLDTYTRDGEGIGGDGYYDTLAYIDVLRKLKAAKRGLGGPAADAGMSMMPKRKMSMMGPAR